MKKNFKLYFGITLLFAVLSLIGSFLYLSEKDSLKKESILYITIAAQALPNENSSYELQRAAEHFSDLVLGWTLDPGFEFAKAQFNGRRQEKQNLLFTVDSPNLDDANELLDAIESRIESYNLAAQSNYLIANANISPIEIYINKPRIIFGAFLASLFLSGALIFLHDTFRKNRS